MSDKARLISALIAATVALAACSRDTGPTTTDFIPPTSELIFSATTTTTTRAPGPLDPVWVESLAVTVDIPRDWEFATEDLRFGRASAAFRASNDTGGLIVVGAVDDVVPHLVAPDQLISGLAPILAALFNAGVGLTADDLQSVSDSETGTAPGSSYTMRTYEVPREDAVASTMSIAVYTDIDPRVFIAVLYEDGFPDDRIEQTNVFDSLEVATG